MRLVIDPTAITASARRSSADGRSEADARAWCHGHWHGRPNGRLFCALATDGWRLAETMAEFW
jgi:hypothetical protein